MQTFEGALARRDYGLVCSGLFAAEVREQAGGEDCPAFLERTAPADLRDPRITIRRIEVRGDRATVQVLSSAGGQGQVPDTLEFVRQGGRWRIASLTG